jgi:hypothetical protein
MANPPTNPAAQALANLRDIHLPAPIHSFWPLAPGWYAVLFLILLALILLALSTRHLYLKGEAKREALQLLAHYQKDYEQGHPYSLCAARISELLKRVALIYFPREKVASLQGKAWLQFLTETSQGLHFDRLEKELLEWPYHPIDKHVADLNPLFKAAALWIKQRRGRHV